MDTRSKPPIATEAVRNYIQVAVHVFEEGRSLEGFLDDIDWQEQFEVGAALGLTKHQMIDVIEYAESERDVRLRAAVAAVA